jgi:peptide/nickel transport system substrate-binding protein
MPFARAITVPNPDKYTYLTIGGPETTDPAWAYDTASAEVIFNVYMCLLDFDFVYLNKYVAEAAEWWPGYGETEGNSIIPQPVHPHVYTNTSAVNPSNPVGSNWTRKNIDYTLTAASDGLVVGQEVTMTWTFDPTFGATEDLVYEILSVSEASGVYTLKLRPKYATYFSEFNGEQIVTEAAETWYFKIRSGIQWQDGEVGDYLSAYDVEYSIERGMVMDHAGGPQWMFYEPLTGWSYGSRSYFNIPTSKYWDPEIPDETAVWARIIDDAVESNETHVWFNLAMPYAPFQQILCQSWGSILDADWAINLPADPVGGKNWNASWHVTPGLQGYKQAVAFNNPPTPGPMGARAMGSGPYYIDYIDLSSGSFRLRKFDNYRFGWDRPHVSTIVHEVVEDWQLRKVRFLSDDPETQADQVTILRENVDDPDLLAAIAAGRVRYLPNLPTLAADAIFWAYNFTDTDYPHYIGAGDGVSWVKNSTLLSDIHMRLALSYCFDVLYYIQDFYKGEAGTLHDPIIRGIAYANDTKHDTMFYQYNLDLATYHFKMAWGGVDADGDPSTMDDVTPGEVWKKGFTVQIEPFPDSPARNNPCYMIEDVVETLIPWDWSQPTFGGAYIIVNPLDWRPGLIAMYSGLLGAYVVGWLADFPHPHNWVGPFMATWGDFSYFQNIQYGRAGIMNMNWHPQGDYVPVNGYYLNYKGEVVNDINNTYVDGLIATGIGLPTGPEAEALYTELMDIYYAEAPSLMTVQPYGRHYERQWVHGWFYNSIYPGLMFYGTPETENLWKEDPATVTRDVTGTSITVEPGSSHVTLTLQNIGENPEYVHVYLYLAGPDNTPIDEQEYYVWLRAGEIFTIDKTVDFDVKVATAIVSIAYWVTGPGYEIEKVFNNNVVGWWFGTGDINADGSTDMADISLMIDLFMTCYPSDSRYVSWGDVIVDATIDMADISLGIQYFMTYW